MSGSPNSNESSRNLVTSQNLETALKRNHGDLAKYKSHSIEDFTEVGDNFLTYVTSIKVKFSVDGKEDEETFIAKLDPYRESAEMDKFTKLVFEKECGFYNKIAPEVDNILEGIAMPLLRVPKCYFAHNDSSNHNIVYLEDMRKKGFALGTRSEGLTKEQAELVVSELGRLHSSSVLVAKNMEPEDMDIKFPFLRDLFLERVSTDEGSMMAQHLKTALETGVQIGEKLDGYGEFVEFIGSCIPQVEDIIKKEVEHSAPFTAILHGDTWTNNLLFKNDKEGKSEEVCLIDMQGFRKASVALDLIHFFFTSLCGEVRQHTRDLLSTYHDSYKAVMVASGEEISFTKEELYAEYRKHYKYGMLMSLLLVPLMVLDSDSIPDLGKISNDNLKEKLKENQENIIKMVDGSPDMKKRFRDIFDDLVALKTEK